MKPVKNKKGYMVALFHDIRQHYDNAGSKDCDSLVKAQAEGIHHNAYGHKHRAVIDRE